MKFSEMPPGPNHDLSPTQFARLHDIIEKLETQSSCVVSSGNNEFTVSFAKNGSSNETKRTKVLELGLFTADELDVIAANGFFPVKVDYPFSLDEDF